MKPTALLMAAAFVVASLPGLANAGAGILVSNNSCHCVKAKGYASGSTRNTREMWIDRGGKDSAEVPGIWKLGGYRIEMYDVPSCNLVTAATPRVVKHRHFKDPSGQRVRYIVNDTSILPPGSSWDWKTIIEARKPCAERAPRPLENFSLKNMSLEEENAVTEFIQRALHGHGG